MKNSIKLFVAVAAVMISLAGCATASSIGGTLDGQGLISQASAASRGGTEIGSYNVYLGLFTQDYNEYVQSVRQAIGEGKEIASVTTWYVFFTTTRAYARDIQSPGARR